MKIEIKIESKANIEMTIIFMVENELKFVEIKKQMITR
jgi:hypothetical protein